MMNPDDRFVVISSNKRCLCILFTIRNYHFLGPGMKYLKSFPLLILFLLAGCTTIEPVYDKDTTADTIKNIHPGDTLYITTVKNEEHKIKVKSVSDKFITAEKIKIPVEQIKTIEKESVSTSETVYVGFGLFISIGITAVMVQLGII